MKNIKKEANLKIKKKIKAIEPSTKPYITIPKTIQHWIIFGLAKSL